MKGVIASLANDAVVDDASHDIPPGDVHAAAWSLGAYWRRYPPGTVHVAVVDPGVGSSRRALAAEVDGRFVVAPDNGILTYVLQEASSIRIVEITAPHILRDDASATFHGRDIFAPAAAVLAAGFAISDLGRDVADPVLLGEADAVKQADGSIRGSVIHVDRFGNLVTSIRGADVSGGSVTANGVAHIPVVRTYSDVSPGECCALVGSRDRLELSVRDGSAAEVLGAARGDAVIWTPDAAPDI